MSCRCSGFRRGRRRRRPIRTWRRSSAARRVGGWKSERWNVRRGRLFAVPGDASLGYRLPLVGAAACREGGLSLPPRPRHHRAARAAARLSRPAPPGSRETQATGEGRAGGRFAAQQDIVEQHIIEGAVRTAMTVEARGNHLAVFLPPTERLEDYLELIAQVEATAGRLGLPVQDRGLCAAARSAPPGAQGDARSRRDRGQRPARRELGRDERNHHQRSTIWRARCGLTADKFMVDGRAVGTGGGNHVVLGGAIGERFAVHPPAGSAEVDRALLAAASIAQLPLLRHVHRTDEPGAAHRRGPP